MKGCEGCKHAWKPQGAIPCVNCSPVNDRWEPGAPTRPCIHDWCKDCDAAECELCAMPMPTKWSASDD